MIPLAIGHPELVVVAGRRIVRRLLVGALFLRVENLLDEVAEDRVAALIDRLRGELLHLGQLGIGDERLVLPLPRACHRRDAVVAPDTLKIRVAVGEPRHFVVRVEAILGGLLGALGAQGRHDQPFDCAQGKRETGGNGEGV